MFEAGGIVLVCCAVAWVSKLRIKWYGSLQTEHVPVHFFAVLQNAMELIQNVYMLLR